MAHPPKIDDSMLQAATDSTQSAINLCDVIEGFQSRDKTLKRLSGELQDLINILNQLLEVDNIQETSTLKLLESPTGRCGKLCSKFEKSMKSFRERSEGEVRDWLKMDFMEGNINTFIDKLECYKSTIKIGLEIVTMSSSKQFHQDLKHVDELILDTIHGLKVQLDHIDDYLTDDATDGMVEPNKKADLQDEREVTNQCLSICEDAKTYFKALQDQDQSLPDGTTAGLAGYPRFEAHISTNRGVNEMGNRLAESLGRSQERLNTMDQNRRPERDFERSRLLEDIELQKQNLEACKRVSNQMGHKKIHTFGETIAVNNSELMVVTTVAEWFDYKKAVSKDHSMHMGGTTTGGVLTKVSKHRYASRFGVVTPEGRIATDAGPSGPLPVNEVKKDAQLADPGKGQKRPSSNIVRKRTRESD